MWDKLVEYAISNNLSIFAILFIAMLGTFIWLVKWVLKENEERENRYIERENKYIGVIQTLSEDVKERLTKIEVKLFK